MVKVKVKLFNSVPLFATPWTVASQAPRCMEFTRQEYQSGLPFPSPGDLPNPGTEPRSPTLQADAFFFFFFLLSHKSLILSYTVSLSSQINLIKFH